MVCQSDHLRREDQKIFKAFFSLARNYGRPVPPETDPSKPENNGGVAFECFFPSGENSTNINNHSVVTVVTYADSKIILTGDNEGPSWKELLEDSAFEEAVADADVLLAPHHGRESGFSADLLEIVKPKLTVVSDGPATETNAVTRYSAVTSGWTVHGPTGSSSMRKCLTTRKDGSIVVRAGRSSSNKPFLEVHTQK